MGWNPKKTHQRMAQRYQGSRSGVRWTCIQQRMARRYQGSRSGVRWTCIQQTSLAQWSIEWRQFVKRVVGTYRHQDHGMMDQWMDIYFLKSCCFYYYGISHVFSELSSCQYIWMVFIGTQYLWLAQLTVICLTTHVKRALHISNFSFREVPL